MRALRAWLTILAIAASMPAVSAGDEAPSGAVILRACIIATSQKSPQGIEQFRPDCPDLERAITDLGYADQLGEDWQQAINRETLKALSHLTNLFEGQPKAAGPDVAALAPALQTLQVHETPRSWWERFKTWLRSWLRSPDIRRADNTWLERLLGRINLPPSLARTVGYLSIAALLAFSLWIVWRELRAAGLLQPKSARERRPVAGQPHAAPAEVPDIASVQALPPWQQPAALLVVLVQTLRQSGRLKAAHALTHRELVERAVLEEASQRTRFQQVVQLAERQIYGAHAAESSNAEESRLRQVLGEGMSLHTELLAVRVGQRS